MSVSAQKPPAIRAVEAELGCHCIPGNIAEYPSVRAEGCVRGCEGSLGGVDIWGVGDVSVWNNYKPEKGRRGK